MVFRSFQRKAEARQARRADELAPAAGPVNTTAVEPVVDHSAVVESVPDEAEQTTPPTKISAQRFGLTEVYTPSPPSSALVDLVFLHGLNGDPQRTWTSAASKAFWPRDLLPQFLEEQKVRVMVYGYDADVTSLAGGGVSKDKIHNHAERLVANLFANRRIRKATERPIIFVAHSLGGLIVKRALIASSEFSGPKTEHLKSIYVSTYAILFLGTPHRGSEIGKWGTYLEWLASTVVPKKMLDSQPQLVEALKTNGETLLNIDRQFMQLIDEFHIYFFHEAKPTDLKGTFRFVVEEDSAAPNLPNVERAGIQADHSHMCKFDDENAPGFDLVVDGIQRYAEGAPPVITARWVSEKEERLTRAVRKAKEFYPEAIESLKPPEEGISETSSQISPGASAVDLTLPDSRMLSKPSRVGSTATLEEDAKPLEPFFIVPPGFRANTFFVGMEKELRILDEHLFDDRRKYGTACVLLHGQAGAGKSHLARQYIFQNRHKFKWGVFWVNANMIDELYKDVWVIAQKVVAKNSPQLRLSTDDLGRSFIDIVREWFERHSEWLIILDSVSVEREEDIQQLHSFVPDSPNSSLIYISRSRRLETMQRLLRPIAIKVPALKEADARRLLFQEIGIAKPRESQINGANTLVKKVGGLPLAISAIAHRLADTHEPIEKYTIKSYAEDPKLGGTYRSIMDEMQKNGHIGALNLINILCFFGSHIPVEMIHLGLKALRQENVEVKSSDSGVKPDLNVTFGILMRHALIERNEPEDNASISSSRDSLVGPDPIDVLNIHTVVQRFCIDNLNAAHLLPIWLKYATRLFVYSFKEAQFRIKNQSKPGRVSDYRWYLVHAQSLRDHTLRYETKRQLLGTIRTELDPALLKIQDEIRAREPGSSQGSVDQVELQISVFDRTSSSGGSSSDQSNPKNRQPGQLDITTDDEFGVPTAAESPGSIDGESPLYRRIHYGHNSLFPQYDEGDYAVSYPMQKDHSGDTLRPASNESAPPTPDWRALTSSFKRNPGEGARPNAFRTSSAMLQIDGRHAAGAVANPPGQPYDHFSGTSHALASLTRIHRSSPSPPGGVRPMWSRASSRGSEQKESPRPIFAMLFGGGNPPRPTTAISTSTPQGEPDLVEDTRTGSEEETARGRVRDPRRQTPLRQAVRPPPIPLVPGGVLSDRSDPGPRQVLEPYGLSQQPQSLPVLPQVDPSIYQRAFIQGSNPKPLSYDSNITVQAMPRHMQSRPPSRPRTNPDFQQYQSTPNNPYGTFSRDSSPFRQGYHSPLVSRDNSNDSQKFGRPSGEPRMLSQASNYSPSFMTTASPDNSPHLRGVRNGSPQKTPPKYSPATNSPVPPQAFPDSNSDALQRYTSSAPILPPISGSDPRAGEQRYYQGNQRPPSFPGSASSPATVTGGTPRITSLTKPHFSSGSTGASQFSPSPPLPDTGTGAETTLSRSSSGPGLAIEGLGIAEFGSSAPTAISTPFTNGGLVLGQSKEEVRIADARRRIREWQRRMDFQERERERARESNLGLRAGFLSQQQQQQQQQSQQQRLGNQIDDRKAVVDENIRKRERRASLAMESLHLGMDLEQLDPRLEEDMVTAGLPPRMRWSNPGLLSSGNGTSGYRAGMSVDDNELFYADAYDSGYPYASGVGAGLGGEPLGYPSSSRMDERGRSIARSSLPGYGLVAPSLGGGAGVPYPDMNRIPAGASGGTNDSRSGAFGGSRVMPYLGNLLTQLTGGSGSGRRRGFSAPESPGWSVASPGAEKNSWEA